MKKLLIFLLLIIVVIIASLPIIGNSLVESTLKNRLEVLTSYGLEVKELESESSYLKSSKVYEVFIKDTDKFIIYLNQFSDAQIPTYMNAMIDGMIIGAEIKYSNFPLSDAVSVEIYPLKLSKKTILDLEASDVKFTKKVSDFLANKGFLYHINYNIANSNFDGYIKDIEETFIVKSGDTAKFILHNAVFNGEGELIAPNQLNSSIKEVSFTLKDPQVNISMILEDISVSSAFESESTYATLFKIGVFKLNIPDGKSVLNVVLANTAFDISSNTQGLKGEFISKSSFDSFSLKSPRLKIDAKNFNYDIALKDVDKDSFAKILELINKAKINQTPQIKADLESSTLELLSRGITFDIADLSLENITLNNVRSIGGFSLKSKFILQEDSNLSTKIKTNKIALTKNIELEILFKMSKIMYDILSKNYHILTLAQGYAQEKNGNIIFDIKMKNEKLTVNSKEIK